MYNQDSDEMNEGNLPGSPKGDSGRHSPAVSAKGASPKKDIDSGFGNYHANLVNTGKDENNQQKASRMAAMKRRMAKAY